MEINIQSVGFKADAKLKEFTKSKITKLVHFSDNIVGAHVFFKVENTQNDENKTVEIKLDIPGKDLFAKKTEKSFEEGVDNVVEALRKQLIKIKEKQISLHL